MIKLNESEQRDFDWLLERGNMLLAKDVKETIDKYLSPYDISPSTIEDLYDDIIKLISGEQ